MNLKISPTPTTIGYGFPPGVALPYVGGTVMCHRSGRLFQGYVFSQGMFFSDFACCVLSGYEIQQIFMVYLLSGYTFREFFVHVFSQGMKSRAFLAFSQGQGRKPRVADPRPS